LFPSLLPVPIPLIEGATGGTNSPDTPRYPMEGAPKGAVVISRELLHPQIPRQGDNGAAFIFCGRTDALAKLDNAWPAAHQGASDWSPPDFKDSS